MTSASLQIVDVRGDALQRGREQGEGAKHQIRAACTRYRDFIPEYLQITWERAQKEAQKYLPHAEDGYSEFIEELRGIAAGANLPFEEIWTLNCFEALAENHVQAYGCTSLAVGTRQTLSGQVFLAHNEDWYRIDEDTVYLVRARPKGKPPFIGMTYGPLLVNIGLNDAGIAVAINSVHSKDVRYGVPRILYSRAILEARNIDQALQAALSPSRAAGYHYLIVSKQDQLCSLETSATLDHLTYGTNGWLVHTNHYLSPKLQTTQRAQSFQNSILRLKRAEQLLKSQLGRVTEESLQTILRDHAHQPESICGHAPSANPSLDQYQTIVSLVMNATEQVIWAAKGPPCEGAYLPYRL